MKPSVSNKKGLDPSFYHFNYYMIIECYDIINND